jgi:DeoR/GlpR family transcriptional regulator of sugar metabolism
MLKAMRIHAEAEKWDEAAAIAKHAAPYIHPHLSLIDMSSTNEHFVYDVTDRPLNRR